MYPRIHQLTVLNQTHGNNFVILRVLVPTLTLPYFQVKRTTTGRQQMMTQDKMRIAVRNTQFRDTTQGRSSSQYSQPSAHCRHSNIPGSLYWLSTSCRQGHRVDTVRVNILFQNVTKIIYHLQKRTIQTLWTPLLFVNYVVTLHYGNYDVNLY